jgi:rhodanese-related sulfurtransferase/DNA-binding HxlR family transcriptional regulator
MAQAHRQFKDAVYEQLARIGKAASAPKRLELLELLCQGPRTVEALAAQAAISTANASQHLQILRAATLVDAEKHGLHVEYRLTDDKVNEFFLKVRTLAESQLVELQHVAQQYLEQRGAMERIDGEELRRRLRRGEVLVLDVRPTEEYLAGHIPGALSVPLAELKWRLHAFPKSRDIVAYCRGPYCVMAIEAVKLLRKKGFRALRMEQGVIEWRARGWRIATGGEAAHV